MAESWCREILLAAGQKVTKVTILDFRAIFHLLHFLDFQDLPEPTLFAGSTGHN